MKQKQWKRLLSGAVALVVTASAIIPAGSVSAADKNWTDTDTGKGYHLITQTGGKTLGYVDVPILEDAGYAFKDLNRNGELDIYEDWRKTTEERATDLASKMVETSEGIAAIAGLMLYSGHQSVPGGGFGNGTYDGEKYDAKKHDAWALADEQIAFLRDDNLRHVLITSVESPEVAAKWNNTAQAFVEGFGFGIPVNTSSDPRHDAGGTNAAIEYQAGAGGAISKWPSSIGMTATFNPDLVKKFGEIASKEYRALGISTALSPQVDLATEPRWSRVNGTFGENSALSADLSRAYVDGFQTTYAADGTAQGWGSDSVNAMVKHWPSGGPEEGGRDGHYGYGKYAVYPGNNFEEQMVPFTEGAFKLNDGTGYASAVMPYYTISYNQDTKNHENVGNGFSAYILTDLLRGKYNYDGVACTDWQITHDVPNDYAFAGKCWGVEDLTETERHYKAIMAGIDQFGGNNAKGPVLGAYDMMVDKNGEKFAKDRFADSARRLLTNIFNCGLFENPYLDPDNTKAVVGNSEFMAEGYNAQLQSVVMIKNKGKVISKDAATGKTVYVEGISDKIAEKFYNVTDDPAKADLAIVGMSAPSGGSGYSTDDLKAGGNGYVPITLQYGEYTADTARETAIANDPGKQFKNSSTGEYVYTDEVANRSYKGKTITARNASELEKLQSVKDKMGDKPVVVYMKATNPMVWSEVEPSADAIVVGYGIQDQAVLEIIAGKTEPSGMLPMQQPANMETVEAQYEDVPQDMDCYRDSQNNVYDFGFGLNWSGKIRDDRYNKYVKGVPASGDNYTIEDTGKGYYLVEQKNGKTLGFTDAKIIEDGGFAFKDLNKNGKLDVYEDWRKTTEERAKDLANKMIETREGIEAIAGLMLYSGHQSVPGGGFGNGTYDGQKYDAKINNAWDLADEQKAFLGDDNLRHVLITSVESPEIAAKWNNTAQAFVEGLGFGIPVNTSSDPRHAASGSNASVEYQAGEGGDISKWPSSIGMTATFNPDLVKKFGEIASKEYRALGISTALSPQVDLATEPRWSRVNGTFGENSALSADLSRAYVDGFQTTYAADGTAQGWGSDSVNAMVKHWPSGGPEEGGRDGHYGYGKYAVYPGNNFEEQMVPFTEGAFKLADGTGAASAVMPYYTISYNQDTKNHENVGNGFSAYILTDLLRGKYNYDGVACTDWQITHDVPNDYAFAGKCWGVEDLTETERHYKALMAGIDQFGGNNAKGPVLGAYDMMVEKNGETFAKNRFADSARRLLTNIFNCGLFENPYLDPDNTKEVVGNSKFMEEGYNAQLQSVVMIKNKNNVIAKAGATKKTVYVEGISDKIAEKFYNVTDDPAKADLAIVGMSAPSGGSGYSTDDLKAGGSGYVPITLQYGAYTATTARATAIANDPGAKFINSTTGEYVYEDKIANRSYRGKTITASNASELTKLQDVKAKMGSKPVVVYMKMNNPMVWSEVEPSADAIVVGYGIQDQAALEIISGNTEPSGLLPMQQPANMETVEAQYEDVPQDMICYKDSQNNVYDFGYGLNWSGKIKDARTAKYVDGKTDTALAQVQASLSASKIYFGGNAGTTANVKVTLPTAARNAVVSYASSNPAVATVSATGVVTAVKKGSAVITATVKLNNSTKTLTNTVTVAKASIKFTKKKKTLKVGKKFTFKAKGTGCTNIKFSITSGKKNAKIKAKTGKLTAKKAGKVTVTAKSGKIKKTFKLTIKK